MALEVELKAWVDDRDATERRLRERFPFEGTFRKEDSYFRSPGIAGGGKRFRLRNENGSTTVTWKDKTVSDGVEVNREHEFGVSDPAAFGRFVLRLGCRPVSRKVKEGLRFRSGLILLELADVAGLGTFLEIEKLLDTDDPSEIERATGEIRSLLAGLGIGEDRIEPRFYTELLARGGKNRGNS